MSATPRSVAHYREQEAAAREAARCRGIIDELRAALNDHLAELQDIATAYGRENAEWTALIRRTRATLLDTLPGAELDAMTKPQRRETLRDVLISIAGVDP